MHSVYKSVVTVICLAVLVTAPTAAAQDQIEGVWKITEVVIAGPNARTISNPAPNPFIFTKKHYSRAFLTAERPALPRQNPTDAQKAAAWTPFAAEAGTYEIKGEVITIHPIIAKNPDAMEPGVVLTSDLKIEGNTLTLTAKATQNGPIANPSTMKLVRVE